MDKTEQEVNKKEVKEIVPVHILCLQGINPRWSQNKTHKSITKLFSEEDLKNVYKPRSKAYCLVQFKTAEAKKKFQEKFGEQFELKNKKVRIRESQKQQDLSKLTNKQNK